MTMQRCKSTSGNYFLQLYYTREMIIQNKINVSVIMTQVFFFVFIVYTGYKYMYN